MCHTTTGTLRIIVSFTSAETQSVQIGIGQVKARCDGFSLSGSRRELPLTHVYNARAMLRGS